MKDTHKVFISDETWQLIRGFLPVARKVMRAPDFSEIDLVELVIQQGLGQMLTDIVSEGPDVLLESFKHIHLEDPEELGRIIVDKLKKRETRTLSKKWRKQMSRFI
ncbi:MAG: hypothetical protein ACFFB5_20715 [Promethearchaeota archaeon]